MTLPVPLSILSYHLAILGKTGAGKSYTMRLLAEQILTANGRLCLVDPTGVSWGLRLSCDGKTDSGFPVVIAGGRHADVPLKRDDGPAIARLVGKSSTPMILDVSTMTVSDRTRFFTQFAEALLVENEGFLHLVLDEAHLFAPQTRVPDPASAMMVHAANALVSLGRARGLRVMLLSQRPAKLHKDSLSQVETLIAMRLVAPQDRKAVEDWIGDQADKKRGAEIVASLPTLKVGEAWTWAPEANFLKRVTFPKIGTFDSMRPEAQSVRVLPPLDVERIRKMLADRQAAEPPKARGKAASAPAASQAEIASAEKRGFERGRHSMMPEFQTLTREVHRIRMAVSGDLEKVGVEIGRIIRGLPDATPQAPAPQESETVAVATRSQPVGGAGLTNPQAAVLKALAWWASMGEDQPSREQIAAIVGWRATSGHLRNILGSLTSGGMIVYPSQGMVSLTPEGKAVAPAPDASATVLDGVRSTLSGPQRQILEALLPHEELTREQVAEACGWSPTSGHLRNVLGSLSTLRVVVYPSRGTVALALWVRSGQKRRKAA